MDPFKTILEMNNHSQLADIPLQTGTRYVKGLRNLMKSGINSCAIMLQGDSTGNGTDEWFYTSMQRLGLAYPAYTVLHSLWNHTLQCYDSPTLVQTGASGLGYVSCVTTSASCPTDARLSITGDIDIRIHVALDDWSPASECLLASRFGSAGNRGWAFGVNADKKLYWWWSENGTDLLGGTGDANVLSTVGMTVNDGDDIWIRAIFDVDNDASGKTVKFYTSGDGVNWVQLGTDVVSSGTTSIFDSNASLWINGRGTCQWTGKMYSMELRKGIDGEIVASPDFGMANAVEVSTSMSKKMYDMRGNLWTMGSGTTQRAGSPTLLLLNASTSGQALAYSTDATRFAKQTPIEPVLSFVSYSHNEGGAMDYPTAYPAFIVQILTKYPYTGVVCCTQNPKKTPATDDAILAHQSRCNLIAKYAVGKDVGLIDAYSAFLSVGNYNTYVSADGIHPTAIGFELWKDEALKYLNGAFI